MTHEQLEEQRRIAFYRKISSIKNWESSLRTLRDFSRNGAVKAAASNNPTGAMYFNGKADGIEELIEKIRISKTIESTEDTKTTQTI